MKHRHSNRNTAHEVSADFMRLLWVWLQDHCDDGTRQLVDVYQLNANCGSHNDDVTHCVGNPKNELSHIQNQDTVDAALERKSYSYGVNCQPVNTRYSSSINVVDVLCMYKRNADINSGVSATYTYDANGNVLTGNGRTYGYTYFNKPATISAGGNSTSYTYGPDDQRLTKDVNNGAKVTTYIGKLYEKTVSGGTTEHRYFISAGDRLVAQINMVGATKTYYNVHTDMLGSVDVITDASGAKASDISFDEFGDPRPGNWGSGAPSLSMTSRGYTGHETDAESGLINMNARLYDPVISRFVSADTVMDEMFNAQNLNRYSYVRNNPFAYTDPTGHLPYKDGLYDTESQLLFNQSFGNISLSGYSGGTGFMWNPTPQTFNGVGSETGNPNGAFTNTWLTNANQAMAGFASEFYNALPSRQSINSFLDKTQTTLDVAGLAAQGPAEVVAPFIDVASAGVSLLRGDYTGAGLSGMAAFPIVGSVFNATKVGRGLGDDVANSVTPKNVQQFESKRAAFRAAKRDAGIPTSQTHITHTKNLEADGLDTRRTATEYDFGGGRKVQEHPAGHKFPDGGVYDKSHFNNHGTGGTKGHYEY